MATDPSTIVGVRTIRTQRLPNEFWVEVETADGRVGLGESYGTPAAQEAYVHEEVAPYLLGRDADPVERHWWQLYANWGPTGIGVESRTYSAVDMALWDLFGKATGRPIHALLGGAVRPRIRAYNTCGGPEYGEALAVPGADVRGIPGANARQNRYEDLKAFHDEPERLAAELLEMGFRTMKIWPLDPIADETDGHAPSTEQIARGLEPLRRIRKAHGDAIDIALEMHGRWDLPGAIRIAKAAEQYRPIWFEDPIPTEDMDAIAAFAAATDIPVLCGENLGPFQRYLDLVDRAGVGVVSADPSFMGGVTGMRRIADLAGLRARSFIAHDCQGPVNLAVAVQVACYARAAALQEMVRAFYFGWYDEFVTGQPQFDQGWLRPPDAPGHGVTLRPEVRERPDVTIRERRSEPERQRVPA